MHKAMARHLLRQHAWSEHEILLAERVLRHDAARVRSAVEPTLARFAAEQPPEERVAWDRLLASLRQNGQLIDALHALRSL